MVNLRIAMNSYSQWLFQHEINVGRCFICLMTSELNTKVSKLWIAAPYMLQDKLSKLVFNAIVEPTIMMILTRKGGTAKEI